MHAQSHSSHLHRQPTYYRLAQTELEVQLLRGRTVRSRRHNLWPSAQLTPKCLAAVTGAPDPMASPPQSPGRLGHRFENFTIGDAARAHLGDVHGDYHNHVHQSEGEDHVGRARLQTLC